MARSAHSGSPADRQTSSPERRLRQPEIAIATPQAESAAEAATPKPSVFTASIQMIGAGLAWLSGAVVGLGAVFSAFGFLVALSYAHMLGVEIRSLRYDYTFYVQCGASFFVSLIVETAGLLFLALILVLAVLFIFRGCSWLYQKFAIQPPFGRLVRYCSDWRGIAYLGLLVLLAIQLPTQLTYPEGMDVSGLLQSAAHEPSAVDPIQRWILFGNEAALLDCFAGLAPRVILVAVLLPLAWFVSRDRSWAVLRTAPFAIVLATSLVFLAREYGTLALPVKFREASMSDEKPLAKLYLLNETERGYVFWVCSQQRARWIPIEKDNSLIFVKERRTVEQIIQSCTGAGQ